MPLYRRVPKRGFTNIFKRRYTVINLSNLKDFTAEEKVNPETLFRRGLLKSTAESVKILGEGTVEVPLEIQAHGFSRSAREKIVQAGGTCEVLSR